VVNGTFFAAKVIVLMDLGTMETKNKIRMKYRYRKEWREKYVTLESIWKWMCSGKYQARVEATRGLRDITTSTVDGMVSGEIAADDLPVVWPTQGEKGQYTGLVLLEFYVDEGYDVLERLRQRVNLWPQTLLSFVGADGRSLLVLIAYRLTGNAQVNVYEIAAAQGTDAVLHRPHRFCQQEGSTACPESFPAYQHR
jgi:hypothetical protein